MPFPISLTVVSPRMRNRHRIQRSDHRLDAGQFRAAFGAFLQVRGDSHALFRLTVPIPDQLFFRSVFHPSVPIARASFPSRNGVKARRNFCTARNTVFFVAFEFDLSTAAISSIPQPSQCRITIAVLSARLHAASAAFIRSANCTLPASRSGEGDLSRTRLSGSTSNESSPDLLCPPLQASSAFRWPIPSLP